MKPSERLRTRPRSASESLESRRPSTSTSPEVNVSRPPMICSSVLLPEPDAPTMAKVSPRRSSKLTSLSTSVFRPPSPYVLAMFFARSKTGWFTAGSFEAVWFMKSLIAQRLRRLRARGAPRGIQGGQQRETEGDQGYPAHVRGQQLAGQFADVVDIRRQERHMEGVLDPCDEDRQLPR